MKRIVASFIILFVMLGVGGCMNNENNANDYFNVESQEFKKNVVEHLNNKYSEKFSIIQFTEEFSGEKGGFFRAVCKSDTRREKCVVYCYPTEDEYNCNYIDNYANVILQEIYAQQIKQYIGNDVMVKCQLLFSDHYITKEELATGVEGLKKSTYYPHMFVFIFADSAMQYNEIWEETEKFLVDFGIYQQYLYIAYKEEMDFTEWEDTYYQNYTSFERYLVDESDVDRIEFSSVKASLGVEKKMVVKE